MNTNVVNPWKCTWLPVCLALAAGLVSCRDNGEQQSPASDANLPAEADSAMGAGQESAPQEMHGEHDSLADDFAHTGTTLLTSPYQLSEPTKAEMSQVITAYLQVADALVKDDEQATDRATDTLAEKVAAVNPTQLSGSGLEAWQNHQTGYATALKEMRDSTGLEHKRSYFSHLSEILYCTIKSFGLKQGELFAAFCPMAFDGKGAYWITDSRELQNPYFGKAMLTCGEIRETL